MAPRWKIWRLLRTKPKPGLVDLIQHSLEASPTLDAFQNAFKLVRNTDGETYARRVVERLSRSRHLLDDSPNIIFDFVIELMRGRFFDLAAARLEEGRAARAHAIAEASQEETANLADRLYERITRLFGGRQES